MTTAISIGKVGYVLLWWTIFILLGITVGFNPAFIVGLIASILYLLF